MSILIFTIQEAIDLNWVDSIGSQAGKQEGIPGGPYTASLYLTV